MINKSISVLVWFFALVIIFSCSKTDTSRPNNNQQTIIQNDTSGTTGRLIVRVLDFNSGNSVRDADVFIYARYEDIHKNIYLNTVRTLSNGQADFGLLLAGNYYLRATNGTKADTSIAQVITRNSIIKNMFLK